MKKKRFTKATRVIKSKTNFVIGGYENEISDGLREEMPDEWALTEEIYDEVVNSPGWDELARRDLRFLGTYTLKDMIHGNVKVCLREQE